MLEKVRNLSEKQFKNLFFGGVILATSLSVGAIVDSKKNAPEILKNEEGQYVVKPTSKQQTLFGLSFATYAFSAALASARYNGKKEENKKKEITAAMLAKKQNTK